MAFQDLLPWVEADAQRDEARNTQWRDAQRTQTIGNYMATANQIRRQLGYVDNLQKALALTLDPNTHKPAAGHEAEADRLQKQLAQYNVDALHGNLNQVETYIQKLYDPNFNAETGMPGRSPIRALGEKLHLAKPQVSPLMQPRAAGVDPTQFETKLTPEEEQQFQQWKQKYAPNDSGQDYDLRGAFKAGLTPDPQTGHWPDTFKKPNHPTFSNQSMYASQRPDLAGTWQGDQYVNPQPKPQTAGELIRGLRAIQQKYDIAAPGIESGEKALESEAAQREKEQATEREMDFIGTEGQKLGMTPEEIKAERIRKLTGTKATSTLGGKGSDFMRTLPVYAESIGKSVDDLNWDDIEEARRQYTGAGRAAKEKLVPDPNSSTGWAAEGYDADGNVQYHVLNVSPQRGMQTRQTTTTDPFGVTSTTVSKPILPGVQTPGAPGQPSPRQTAPPGKQIRDLKQIQGKRGAPPAAAPQAPAPFQVDSEGHIPASANLNPQLREAANNLLDGMAVKDLQVPPRDKTAAQDLARKYGWAGQGMFTPRDKLLVRESQGILKQFSNDPSLAVLDNTASRLKVQQVLQSPDKRGWIGQTIQALTAQGLTPQEAQFITLYNQAVGRISGLSQLVRSGRATEAQIERLKLELPNPATTSGSAHARQKFAQIQNEIDIALQKGQFQAAGNSVDDIDKALDEDQRAAPNQ